MDKKCGHCKETKPLSGFYIAPKDGAAAWHGSSRFCIDCHDKGLVKHGYGWYGENYKKPDWVTA